MKIDARQLARPGLRNLLLAAFVFLPLFVGASAAEVKLRGLASLQQPAVYHLGAAAVIYVSMLIPALVGVLVQTAVVMVIAATLPRRWRRIVAFLSSPLLPMTVILMGLSGALLLSSFYWSTAIATVVYGLTCSTAVHTGTTSEMNGEVASGARS
jgi:hypothetical protein